MSRLKEGNYYYFSVEKRTVSPDNTSFFVLTGPGGRKYLLPEERYCHYGMIDGTRLRCRVDRINCRGEIFIEPPNPFYNEGGIYHFTVKGYEKRIGYSGESINVMFVEDKFGHLNYVVPEEHDEKAQIGATVKLKVEKISKGRLFLHGRFLGKGDKHLKVGNNYEFKVMGVAKGINGEDYFIVKDIFGLDHTISKHYYESYGLKKGVTFRGKVIKFGKDGGKIIEPDHPFYTPGALMELRIDSISENSVNGSFTIDLTDEFGFSHCIEMKERPGGDHLLMRVRMVRKGRPLLDPM